MSIGTVGSLVMHAAQWFVLRIKSLERAKLAGSKRSARLKDDTLPQCPSSSIKLGYRQPLYGNAARYSPPTAVHGSLNSGALSAPESARTKEDFMCAEHRRARKGRPRKSIPEPLPDDLFDYADDPAPDGQARAEDTPLLGPNGQRMCVTDDCPRIFLSTKPRLTCSSVGSATCSTNF
ncbi:Uncharacterised protein [Escherichia coli]|nr:Uncharacterised protein [Escherichia coli]